jgi:hypothetical protein
MSDLAEALRRERLASYARLRGGFPVPLAGAVYWAALAALGYVRQDSVWYLAALFGSGAIFPLALLFGAVFRNNFMKDRSVVTSVLAPAFTSMLLFWPMAIAALWQATGLFSLILAIGMSLHWPVIGWSYGRPALFSAHAVSRAVVAFLIWWKMPEARLTLLPASVAAIYLLTVLAIYIDSGLLKNKLRPA